MERNVWMVEKKRMEEWRWSRKGTRALLVLIRNSRLSYGLALYDKTMKFSRLSTYQHYHMIHICLWWWSALLLLLLQETSSSTSLEFSFLLR